MEGVAMKEIFISAFGKPYGIVLFQLIEATQYTIYLSLIAFIGGGIMALFITLMRISPDTRICKIAIGYIWLFQSTPLLMLLFLFGLGAPRLLDVDVDPWFAASTALTLYASAYIADVWRGAIQSLPVGQWEGGKALGFKFFRTLRLIILPQAFKISIPPTVGFMVQIIKATSLAYIIGFRDLMAIGKRWANSPVDGTEPFIIFPLMALIYFGLCYPLAQLARRLEKKAGQPNRGNPSKP